MASKAVVEMASKDEAERKANGPSAATLARLDAHVDVLANGKNEGGAEVATATKAKAKQTRNGKVKVIVSGNGGNGKAKAHKPLTSFDEAAKVKVAEEAAKAAEAELKGLDKVAVKLVAEWWVRNFRTAGHKRLGRALVARVKNGKK